MKCLSCLKEIEEKNNKWCCMKYKEEFFIKYFENTQWVYQLINKEQTKLLKKVEALLIFPFEGALEPGKELNRVQILDMQRTQFNKLRNQYRIEEVEK